jgi:hypothetical protein
VREHRAFRVRGRARGELDQQYIRWQKQDRNERSGGKRHADIDRRLEARLAHHGPEVDVEKPLDVEKRLALRLLEAEVDLRRLEARIDRHGNGADERRAVEER